MNIPFAREHIELSHAERAADNGWKIHFRSTHADRLHQLYLDGMLADRTEQLDQRTFFLSAGPLPRRMDVIAVDPACVQKDFSLELGFEWVAHVTLLQNPRYPRTLRAVLLGDQAEDTPPATPLAEGSLNPRSQLSYGMGQEPFGLGGWGFDAAYAPAMRGRFGAGPFGMDARELILQAPLMQEGTHRLKIHLEDGQGVYATTHLGDQIAYPPPESPESLRAIHYDASENLLTLQIQ
jgi:hypothetical protein